MNIKIITKTGKEIKKEIMKIEISNKMIDFERERDSFFYYFSDIGESIQKIIIEDKKND